MELSYLESLEKKYNFQYPEMYKQLCKDGMLDTGEFGTGWVDRNYDRIKDHPIFLIWSSDVEMIEEFELDQYINDIKDPDIWCIKPEFQLIPFAQNGGGDWYCFYYSEQQGEDVPVVMIYHDDNTFVILSKNLQDFIFRNLLETVSDYYLSASEKSDIGKVVWDLRSMFESHKKYLTDRQLELLQEIYSKEFKMNQEDSWGMITADEASEILKQTIDFPLLDKEVVYYNGND